MMPIADDFDWGAAIRYGLDGPDVTAELNVTSFHDGPYGGGILIGHDAERRLRRVIIVANDLVRRPCEGEIWRVTGPERTDPVYREQIHARVALPLMVSGSAIIRYLATNKRFLGVGWTTAQRLWDEFGPRLYEVIKTHDYRNLATVIGTERAISVVQGFDFLADEIEVFQWLDRYGVSARTAGVAIALWGKEAIEKIRTDPYTLALLEPWRCVDERALKLGLSPTDQRRLVAAVEEAFARHYRSGHTAANERHLIGLLQTLLGFHAASVAPKAIEAAIEAGRVVRHADGLLQGRAAWWMEREVERVFAERMTRRVPAPAQEEIGAVIAAIETADGYQLAHKQKEAIHMAVSSPLSIVCGGAGTGKTTIVKAVLQVLDYPQANSPAAEVRSVRHAQIALAGRAVKRITDMTGRDAMTIARFYHELKAGKTRLKKGLLVIDESSMVDLPTFYKMLTMIPSETNLLFIGDPAQLPPIGPGIVFHKMVESGTIPLVELDVIHRHEIGTGIAEIADEIRLGRMPDLPLFNSNNPLAKGVYIVPTKGEEATGRATLDTFCAMAGPAPHQMQFDQLHDKDIQILCSRKKGPAGFSELNRRVENIYMAHQLPVHNWGLRVGSKIIWLKNDYQKNPIFDANGYQAKDYLGESIYNGFMNGTIGTIRAITPTGARLELDDGAIDVITDNDLEKLTFGWAFSIHKSQGSAFRRVICPITKNRLLDRAMIYTAITRAVESVVLVGDVDTLRCAIKAPFQASRRVTKISFSALD